MRKKDWKRFGTFIMCLFSISMLPQWWNLIGYIGLGLFVGGIMGRLEAYEKTFGDPDA